MTGETFFRVTYRDPEGEDAVAICGNRREALEFARNLPVGTSYRVVRVETTRELVQWGTVL